LGFGCVGINEFLRGEITFFCIFEHKKGKGMAEKMTIAQALIAENKRTKSKKLDLGSCGLTELPEELFECVWLEELHLGEFDALDMFDELSRGEQDIRAEYVNQEAANRISDISGIQHLYNLQSLNISENQIFDISQLKSLQKLQELNFFGNYVSDISILNNLINLEYLSFGYNQVKDLSPLKDLKNLEIIAFSENGLKEFPYFLKSLPSLKNIYFLPNPYQIKGYQAFDLLLHSSSIDADNTLEIFIQIADAVEKQIKEQENWINLKIPKEFERIFSQYILLFKEYILVAKGKIIEFHLRSENDSLLLVSNGKTNINRDEILNYLEEYVLLLRQNLDTGRLQLNIENQEIKNNPDLENQINTFALKWQLQRNNLQSEIQILALENKNLQNELSIYQLQSQQNLERILFLEEMWRLEVNKTQENFDIEKITTDLIEKLARMQERKHTKKHEDLHNDDLTDFLRDKNYYATDQTRSGKSQKNAGELDIMIRKINGTPVSIIEAMRLKSCGEKNNEIAEHLYKLLYDYDSNGLERNFLIVYAEAKNFDDLWENYRNYMSSTVLEHSKFKKAIYPQKGGLIPKSGLSEYADLKVGVTKYQRASRDIEVFHLFVNMYVG